MRSEQHIEEGGIACTQYTTHRDMQDDKRDVRAGVIRENMGREHATGARPEGLASLSEYARIRKDMQQQQEQQKQVSCVPALRSSGVVQLYNVCSLSPLGRRRRKTTRRRRGSHFKYRVDSALSI